MHLIVGWSSLVLTLWLALASVGAFGGYGDQGLDERLYFVLTPALLVVATLAFSLYEKKCPRSLLTVTIMSACGALLATLAGLVWMSGSYDHSVTHRLVMMFAGAGLAAVGLWSAKLYGSVRSSR